MSKKNSVRDCPAAGRQIEAFECATSRHTTCACPEHCQHNPFSLQNYESYRKIENSAEAKLFNWMLSHGPKPGQLERIARSAQGETPDSGLFHGLAWCSVYRKDPNGATCLEQMGKQGFPGATADEIVFLRAKMRMRPVVVEARRVIDDRQVEVLDLLDPGRGPLVITDRTLAGVAVRFGVYAGHAYALPHYHRIFGSAYVVPCMSPLDPKEIVQETIRHLGGATDEASVRDWLMENYPRFEKALLAVGLARRKLMFEHLDVMFGKAVYELAGSFEESRERLRLIPEIADDPLSPEEEAEGFVEGRVWFANRTDPEHDAAGEGATLGRVLLSKTHWRLDCMGGSQLDRFRTRFESLMQDRVRFVGERRDDLAAQLRLKDLSYDGSLVAPALLRNPQLISTAIARIPARVQPELAVKDHQHQQAVQWLDNHVPALNGRTPREAASDPGLRPELIQLMKERVRDWDTRNLETGRSDDINWMIRELGLTEILFDPPPARPRIRMGGNRNEDEEDEFEELEYPDEAPRWFRLPSPPPLPNAPLTTPEALALFERALASFPQMTDAVDYLLELEYPLLGFLADLSLGLLSDKDVEFLAPTVCLLVVCYCPSGFRPPEIDFDELKWAFHTQLSGLDLNAPCLDGGLGKWLESSRQPELLRLFLLAMGKLVDEAPKKLRPGKNAKMGFVIVLRVLVDEFDRLLRTGE